MSPKAFQSGFSLTEVLMAAGILLVGFLLIAGTFPVGVKLTAVATERTIGVVAAEEAMAKIHLYGINDPAAIPYNLTNEKNPAMPRMIVHVPYDGISVAQYSQQLPVANRSDFISSSAFTQLKIRYPGIDTLSALTSYFQYESLYPSTVFFDYSVPAQPQIKTNPDDPQRYFWSALCRRLDSSTSEIQVTIFVGRMAGEKAAYPRFEYNRPTGTVPANCWTIAPYPTPVPVEVTGTAGTELYHRDAAGNIIPGSPVYFSTLTWTTLNRAMLDGYIGRGAMLLDDVNSRMMRVLEVRRPDPANPNDLGEIRMMQAPDTDGNPKTVEAADMEGLLMFGNAEYVPAKTRIVWVVPPAIPGTLPATIPPATNVPPKVAGRNPCVGVYQGQL